MSCPKPVKPVDLGDKKVPLGTLLRDAARLLEGEEAHVLPPDALDPYLISLLWRVNARPGLMLSEYANSHGIDLASYSRWANKLVDLGLLLKHLDGADSRRRRLYMTDAGMDALDENLKGYESVEAMVEGRMGSDSYFQLRKMLAAFIVTLPKG